MPRVILLVAACLLSSCRSLRIANATYELRAVQQRVGADIESKAPSLKVFGFLEVEFETPSCFPSEPTSSVDDSTDTHDEIGRLYCPWHDDDCEYESVVRVKDDNAEDATHLTAVVLLGGLRENEQDSVLDDCLMKLDSRFGMLRKDGTCSPNELDVEVEWSEDKQVYQNRPIEVDPAWLPASRCAAKLPGGDIHHATRSDKPKDPTMAFLELMAEARSGARLTLEQMEILGEPFGAIMIDGNVNAMVQLSQASTQAQVKSQMASMLQLDGASNLLKATSGSGLGPVAERALVLLTDSMYQSLKHSIGFSLTTNLQQALNQTVIWQAQSALSAPLTKALINSIGEAISKVEVLPMQENTIRALTHEITLALTPSVSFSVYRSLTRSPQDDYYCYYCNSEKKYCDYCKESLQRNKAADKYLNDVTNHYSSYYARYFSGISKDSMKEWSQASGSTSSPSGSS